MTNEEILKKAQEINETDGEYENHILRKASILSEIVAIIAAIILYFSEFIIKGTANFSVVALLFAICGTDGIYEGIILKRKGKIVEAIVCFLVMIVCLTFYVIGLVK